MSTSDPNALVGHTVLWVGAEAHGWGVSDFAAAARFARSLGFDTLSPKRADGSIKWYGTPEQLAAERAAVLAEGCGYLPFLYAYGPRFGEQQVRDECAVLQEMGTANAGAVMVDMEAEWNGADAAAALFESCMRPWPGVLYVTTWADPNVQNWDGVAAALAPCVNAWVPQRYNNWLAAQPALPEQTIIQPGVDLSQEFGANNPATIASGQETVWVWEYELAQSNPALARAIATRAGTPPPPPPPPPPPSGNGLPTSHTVVPGDTLWALAAHYYGNGADWPAIWHANLAAVPNANILHIGLVLTIPAL